MQCVLLFISCTLGGIALFINTYIPPGQGKTYKKFISRLCKEIVELYEDTEKLRLVWVGKKEFFSCLYVICDRPRTATGIDGTLNTDFRKSETSRDIKKYF